MYIKSIELKNFRCYEKLKADFNREYTVLVGINGAGKSSLLDAVITALGSYLAGFDGIPSNGIQQDDVRLTTQELGSRIDTEPQYPTEISCTGDFEGREIAWKRSLRSKNGRTIIVDARPVMDYGKYLQKFVSAGDKNVILPVIACYGTGRLYFQKQLRSKNTIGDKTRRTNGYLDCLNPAANDRMLMKWFEQMTAIQIQEQKHVPELDAVRSAMERCFASEPGISEVSAEYRMKSQEIELSYLQNGIREKMPLRLLSDGIRTTLSMVADIAYRMAELNPQLLDQVLVQTPGVVLIDEIDMHLHPAWQKHIMSDLHTVFPKVQFIVTTHAPSVLANVADEHILLLKDNQIYAPDHRTYGRNIDSIMLQLMGVDARPAEISEKLRLFYDLLTEEKYEKARNVLDELEQILGENDSDVVEARTSYDVEQI